MIKFNTHFIPSREDSALRKIVTLISVVAYFFFILIGYSAFNYFLISGLIIVQLYFIISNSKESYEFNNNRLIYTNLVYKKVIDFTSYSITNGEYKDSYKRKSNGQLIQLYADNKIVCRIKEVHNKYLFDEILSYLKTNYPEIKKNEDFEISFVEKEYIIITSLIFSSFIIFILSFSIENYQPDKIQEYKTIKGYMAYQPEIDFSGKRKNRKEYLIFKLKEYPQIKFNLQYENFNKINGYEFVKTNHQNNLIEFEIFKEDNDYKIKKLAQPYFYSHLNNKKIISIQALKYQNKELIQIDFSNKFQGRFDLLLMYLGVLLIVLITYNIYCITRILK
ncbi:hypothetical protein [Empedobacter falsenii]|uniref:hypothetical protein n=1 Tax=Empedobacter falsenii TaxID=343874 RepID=UPI0005719B5E|nr:hypothetical protein [Empedobacter falsenii]